MVEFSRKDNYCFDDLVLLVKKLRSETGCPWDREQTHDSIRMNFIEEVYEACDAIDNQDLDGLKEELGDVLAQVVFHSQIEDELSNFNINDVIDTVCKKFVYRHPHVFKDTLVSGADEVLINWEKLKKTEKSHDTHGEVLSAIPRSLPALMRADKLQKKARKAGFDWDDVYPAIDKVKEEIAELEEAIKNDQNQFEELGDLFFALCNVSRLLKFDSEETLDHANQKFLRRFVALEKAVLNDGKIMEELSLSELDSYWEKIKLYERRNPS